MPLGLEILSVKLLGGSNQASNVYATWALKKIKILAEVKGIKLERPLKPTVNLSLPRPSQSYPNRSGYQAPIQFESTLVQ